MTRSVVWGGIRILLGDAMLQRESESEFQDMDDEDVLPRGEVSSAVRDWDESVRVLERGFWGWTSCRS